MFCVIVTGQGGTTPLTSSSPWWYIQPGGCWGCIGACDGPTWVNEVLNP